MKRTCIVLMLGLFLVACAPTGAPTGIPTVAPATSSISLPATATLELVSQGLWISPAVPESLRSIAQGWGSHITPDPSLAALNFGVHPASAGAGSQWIYALVAPFPTLLDGVTSAQLQAVWKGSSSEAFGKWPLLMTASTLSAFTGLWGAPAITVQVVDADKMIDTAWEELPAWAIVPFESVEPRWKVLTVDGQSPIRKDFAADGYPLQLKFSISAEGVDTSPLILPSSNRDPNRLATVIMTGTTALVREIAYQMEVKGLEYPGRDIGDLLREADVLHVSDEVSFDPNCPPPRPYRNRFFCSDPRYIGLFESVGVDIVELTGNHILDNGEQSLLYTLDWLTQHNISYFGGGANLDDARKVLMIDYHGNKLAFLGCIAGEPPEPLATDRSPGANPCDYKLLTTQIASLRSQGYLPIVTFQYKEGYSPQVMPWQEIDFRKAAAAGAVVVSGSQSHVPMKMEFYQGAFVHYGLGNLFFGQMANQPPAPGLPLQPAERYEFLDRHVFYDGRYIGTELLTAMLEDYARPRPMTPDERNAFLNAYFGYSGWLPLIPTPGPELTPTRYPLLQYSPLPTHTPLPEATPRP